MSSHCFLEGANIHHYAFVEGAIILPCQLLGGQMSTHAIFHSGADVRGGGGKCPAPVTNTFHCHNACWYMYEGCPSKSWTFVITQDCVQVTL